MRLDREDSISMADDVARLKVIREKVEAGAEAQL